MCDRIEFFMKHYLHVQICSFRGLLLAQYAVFFLFGPPFDTQNAPKKNQHLWFGLNEGQYQISGEKLILCANLQFLRGYF